MSTNEHSPQSPMGKPLTIAVLAEDVQLTDITCIDCLTNCSTNYAEVADATNMSHLVELSSPMTVHWPSSTMKPCTLTGSFAFQPTCTYEECPRDLDILLIGGPRPSFRPEGATKLMKECWTRTKIVMTTCVGSWWLADAGVLKGQRVTTNRFFLDTVRKMYPDTQWENYRWVVDEKEGGELWTAGGAQAGIDMVATYVRKNFPAPLAGFALEAIDVDETARGNSYKEGAPKFIGPL